MVKKTISIVVPLFLFFLTLALPAETFHMPGLTVVEQRVIAIFVLAASSWMLEPVPIFATSVGAITLLLLMVSDKGIVWFSRGGGENFGTLMSNTAIIATFASPIIMLFLGGFFLAIAATKYSLDMNLARIILKPFGSQPRWIMLGLMLITAIFSMFMSNTATTSMMLAVLTPVLASFPAGDRGRTALALSIPVAANIGGIGTPIGTPPNAIAMQYITKLEPFSFGKWMLFATPYMLIMLAFSWLMLYLLFPSGKKSVTLAIESAFDKSPRAIIAYVVFALTVILWMLGDLHGMNANVVAMIPLFIYTMTGVVTKKDLQTISWDVLWLLSGGIALGLALDKTGLAARMVSSIPFGSFSPFIVLLAASGLALVMANLMSHTATANLLLPLMAALAPGLGGLEAFGGPVGLLIAVTFACSLGMSLPISTPPNALAMATGTVETRDMAKIGVVVGIVGLFFSFFWLFLMNYQIDVTSPSFSD